MNSAPDSLDYSRELERELAQALAQQAATSAILRAISSSPTDLQTVLMAVAESAARLCDADIGQILRVEDELLRVAASYGPIPSRLRGETMVISRGSVAGRAIVDRGMVHVHDLSNELDKEFPDAKPYAMLWGHRTVLAMPLLREGIPVGAIFIRRTEVRPFSEKEIEVLRTFADKAVIAIENVRLLRELHARNSELARSVQELSALGEVVQAVNSTLDLTTVLTTIVTRAVQLSETDAGVIFEFDDGTQSFQLRAAYHTSEELIKAIKDAKIGLDRTVVGKAALAREAVQIPNISADEPGYPLLKIVATAGFKAMLVVPLLREHKIVGSLVIYRRTPGQFNKETTNLLQTLAAQSSIAIQNACLFDEIREKGYELEIASKHKSQFLANMSHELRTPLNAILGYTDLILDNIYDEVPEKIRDVLQRVAKNGRHLLDLINEVLDISKMEAGQLSLVLNEYCMADVVQTAANTLEGLAAEKEISLKVSIPLDLPIGRGDEHRLTQVLMNLVGNAIKFTEAGEVRVEVRISDGAFLVSVADTGPGIAPADQQHIFEEFRQLDNSIQRTRGGTGLGLAITKRIVELHGGRIWVESQLGEGSIFHFRVPQRVSVV